MPNSAKFFKELLSNKDRLREIITLPLSKECSLVPHHGIPPKLGDTGRFMGPYYLQYVQISNALADLGASVNLMPYSLFKKLGLNELRTMRMTIQLADRSVKIPQGIAEDILVRVDKFAFPVDFIIMDIEADTEVPFILGRPFLNTAKVVIDIHEKSLKLRVSKEEVTFNVDQLMNHPREEDVSLIDSLQELIDEHLEESMAICSQDHIFKELFPTPYKENLDTCSTIGNGQPQSLTTSNQEPQQLKDCDEIPEPSYETKEEVLEDEAFRRTISRIKEQIASVTAIQEPEESEYQEGYDPLDREEITRMKSSIEEPPELELKKLPERLEYAFLEGDSQLPVIISKELTPKENAELIKVLKSHKRAIAWKISDIKGISPNYCSHKIFMEVDFKPSV
ncbi:uncharacterized protein [Rutidosis leptorrhynchoides]|uniref:uncharacterized protein n=1 Tax=Rutidosis leptorrhynchoides TaxID=125765 RepID=UPI003A993931